MKLPHSGFELQLGCYKMFLLLLSKFMFMNIVQTPNLVIFVAPP